jgi:hypothetical protein
MLRAPSPTPPETVVVVAVARRMGTLLGTLLGGHWLCCATRVTIGEYPPRHCVPLRARGMDCRWEPCAPQAAACVADVAERC